MGKSAPEAPDPVATAAAQAQYNQQTAQTQQQLNMVNQVTPYGSLTYTQSPGIPVTGGQAAATSQPMTAPMGSTLGAPAQGGMNYQKGGGFGTTQPANQGQNPYAARMGMGQQQNTLPQYTATTTFSPGQQAIFDQSQKAQLNMATTANNLSGTVQDALSKPFSFNNDDASNWAYDLASPRILQQQGQNEENIRSTLANKGIREGSAAWNSELSRLTNANTDQLNQLALNGRGQAFNEQFTQYNNPLNTLNALLTGSQVQAPNAANAQTPQASVGGVDYTGLVNNQYNQQNAAYQSQLGGLGGLFGMGAKLLTGGIL